jgi:hypothetical protein
MSPNQTMTLKMRPPYLLIAIVALCAPCLLRAESAPLPATPFLLHLNGVGGERSIDQTLVRGIRQAGFDGDVQIYDWTGGKIGIEALQGRERHEAEARKIADIILAHHHANPGAPVHVTSHSGGTGLAVWALELLPEDVRVETFFMFAPALSPEYDLTKALKHVTKNLYVFSSPHDTVVLSTGCKLFGTIDGVKCEAAGVKGFVQPTSADPEQYKKLVHFPYKRTWLRTYGNAGSHICAMRYRFAKDYVGPLFLTGKAPEDPVEAEPETAAGK